VAEPVAAVPGDAKKEAASPQSGKPASPKKDENKKEAADKTVSPDPAVNAAAPVDPKAAKAEKKKAEAEAKAKAEQEKKDKKEAEKEAKKQAKEAKEKEKKEAEEKKKLEKEQKSGKSTPAKADTSKKPAEATSSDKAVQGAVPATSAQAATADVPKTDKAGDHDAATSNVPLARKDTDKDKPTILQSIASIFKKKEGDDVFAEQKIVFVLGGPGSGKGTQCARIKEKYRFDHISAGDLLRNEVAQDTEQGRKIADMIKEGLIVPVEITLSLLRADLEKRKEAKGFLIDGFPRQIDQAVAFESALRSPDLILFFECPENILEGRLLKRGETSGRLDDNAESIRKRFQVFAEVSSKCIEHYEKEGKVKLLKVDASGEESAVWEAVQKGFSESGLE